MSVPHQGLRGVVKQIGSAAAHQIDVHHVPFGIDRYLHQHGTLPAEFTGHLGVGAMSQ